MSSFPDAVAEAIGPVRWRLQVPHLGLADFRRLQSLMLRQYARRSRRTMIAVCAAIGLAIGLLPTLAAGHWNVWLRGSLAFGIGLRTLLIVEYDRVQWALIALALASAVVTWLFFAVGYRVLIRRIYDTARRTTPQWSLEIGENGLHMVLNEIAATIPWSDVLSLQSTKTASFLALKGYLKALGIAHAGFSTDAERDACLAFMTAKIATAKS
jgi:hypothetical protein